MFIQVSKFLKACITKWRLEGLKDIKDSNNPFATDHQEMLMIAKGYLEPYIEKEVQKVIHDKQMLVFTNCIDRPFIRECGQQELELEQLTNYIENMMGRILTEYERAFLAYTFYNEVEELILKGIWRLDFFNSKKLSLLLTVGQEILYTDLQEVYAAYDSKKVWLYHLNS